ncbi:hypothetical protein ACFC1R_30235 [Kitasatospora sp. NPDC056138]|uniref:hypothetical protein n=1 Tax=Kitasatospora sp. NPDC056138 TaxID=3345724 RepID=UPI0035D8426D
MARVTNDVDLHPVRIPGYHDGPFNRCPELLDERLFWMRHLYTWGAGGARGLFFGPDYAWADHRTYQQRLWQRTDWPVFTIPLAAGLRLHVVYRMPSDYHAHPDEAGVDYLVHHPDWDGAELLARDDGHFMGPGLSWPELVAVADNGLPGGTTTDPYARLLLLLPACGDDALPQDAVDRLVGLGQVCSRVGMSRWQMGQEPAQVARMVCSSRTTW